jgi:hypothetical protein
MTNVNDEPDKWDKASEITDPHERMKAYSTLIDQERSAESYPRKVIRYAYGDKNYYVVNNYDFGSQTIAEKDIDDGNKGHLANHISRTKIETQTSLLYDILDDCEDELRLPSNLQAEALAMIKENHLQGFQSELVQYCFANKKPEKHPLENIDPKAAALVNMMLQNFSLVTIEKDFPAPSSITAVETLTL